MIHSVYFISIATSIVNRKNESTKYIASQNINCIVLGNPYGKIH